MRVKKILKDSLFALILIFLAVLIFLGGLELVLRVFTEQTVTPGHSITHATRRYTLRPNFRGKTYKANLKINSYGLRDYEREVSIGNEAYRICIFGDSVTFGIGVELEDTFPKILEKKFNRLLCPKKVQIFNMGVGSYNTVQEYIYLKESYDKFRPHMVIFEYTAGNDASLTSRAHMADINRIGAVRWIKDLFRKLYCYNFLASEFYSLLYRISHERKSENEYEALIRHDERLFDVNFEGWHENKQAFDDIFKFCGKHKIALIFAIYANNTMLSPFLEKDPYYQIIKKVIEALEEKGIVHHILLDDQFRKYADNERALWVTETDHHFSPLAHKLVAEALFKYICKNRFIEKYYTADKINSHNIAVDS